MPPEINKVLVAQIGARMHYAVPRIIHESGMLAKFHTDICAVKGWPTIVRHLLPSRLQPKGLQRLLGRIPTDIPPALIQAHTSFGLEYFRRLCKASCPAERTSVYLWAAENFCWRIINCGFGEADAVYTFNSAGLELLREAKRRGLHTILEQTSAPRSLEHEIISSEYSQCSDLNVMIEPDSSWQRFAQRETEEWDLADIILCGSQFVANGIKAVGGPFEKTKVVPYGIDLELFSSVIKSTKTNGSLNVLFVGRVSIPKGAHYLIEAARLLETRHPNIQFKFVGAVSLPSYVLEALPSNVTLTGMVPRAEIAKHYAWADVFCLPSLCEGSATVTYEALAMGVPVICTPNAGSVVRDGIDGYIVPIRDCGAIAERIKLLEQNNTLRAGLGINALKTAHEYSFPMYSNRLIGALKHP
jgi:glycosyltransferase involved in cell wall biosynthesis